ncbi:MAG: DUF350 domain-containing protein [Polyangia bacterium]|mgnify:CR=1 FL=1|nr:DUF350 domain-containing protein [Polyangia bacterium]
MMRGKMRFAAVCGIVLIFGASALAVGKRARQADKEKDKVEAVGKAEKDDKAAPEPAAPAEAGAAKFEVKCNIPPITVNTAPAAAPAPIDAAASPGKRSRSGGAAFDWGKIGHDLVLTLIFSLLGLAIALFGYFVYHWIVPFDLRKELEIDQNTSLGIVAGSIILGLCIIVAAAIASPS